MRRRNRFLTIRRPTVQRQRLLPFLERARRLDRGFKAAIAVATVAVVAVSLGLTPRARDLTIEWTTSVRQEVWRGLTGLGPTREETEQVREARRDRSRRETLASLTRFYRKTSPEMRRLFDLAGMDPKRGLIGVGRPDNGFLLSSKVFEADDQGRSYRLRPETRSVWLRQVTLIDGPFGLFLVPDTPEVRQAAAAVGAIVDEGSRQTTNSWGLRGPEPDPNAEVRGIVLGDSFMQGMFVGDDRTPPLELERALRERWGRSVSILNTGHIGYAPEQYYHSLIAFGDRFRPDFVVISVCPNDFGDGDAVMAGGGDGWEEAAFWIGEIVQWCRSRTIPYLLVPAPVDRQIVGVRHDGHYPGRVSDLFPGGGPSLYLNPFEDFLDEHLRLLREDPEAGPGRCPLFNASINDNHFSPRGSKLWADRVARRLASIVKPPGEEAVALSGQ